MKTYVYAEHCVRAGDVVIPQPEGKDKESDDFTYYTLGQAREIIKNPDCYKTFSVRAARNILEFRS